MSRRRRTAAAICRCPVKPRPQPLYTALTPPSSDGTMWLVHTDFVHSSFVLLSYFEMLYIDLFFLLYEKWFRRRVLLIVWRHLIQWFTCSTSLTHSEFPHLLQNLTNMQIQPSYREERFCAGCARQIEATRWDEKSRVYIWSSTHGRRHKAASFLHKIKNNKKRFTTPYDPAVDLSEDPFSRKHQE